MCGIVGLWERGANGARADPALVAAMRDTLAHRGPDGAGLWLSADGRLGLGHRRLAVLDRSPAASQPMASDDGAVVLAFNGEIYNYAALRAELEAAGVRAWRTDHSDTEVLLRAWERWGVACLARLRGMFAFAVWREDRRELWLVRDRLGIKPLYYVADRDRLAFASEIKALLADPRQRRAVDDEAFFYYLTALSSPPEATLFAGVRKVPAASWVRLDAGGELRQARYWDPYDDVTPLTGMADAAIAARVQEGLREAVRLRSTADVPVGTFLSGGVDSSAVSALLAEGGSAPVRTFTVEFAGTRGHAEEVEAARLLAARIGATHRERLLDADAALERVPRTVRLQDEPSGHGVDVATLCVAELARQDGVVVVLTGEGADELYGGYPEWLRIARAQRLVDRAGRWGAGVAARGLAALGRGEGARAELLARAARGEPLFWGGAEGWTHRAKMRLVSPRLRARFAARSPCEILAPIHARFRARAWERTPLAWMTYVALHTRLPEMVLKRLDRMTMGVGVEGRVPFLDHHGVGIALGVPTAVKLRHGRPKHLLKASVRDLVPRRLIARRKRGFAPVPVGSDSF